jgi:hypothetical protein
MLARRDLMLNNGSAPYSGMLQPISGPGVLADRRRSRVEPSSRRFVLAAALGVGVVSFLATEFMH